MAPHVPREPRPRSLLEDAALTAGLSEDQVEAIESGYAPRSRRTRARIHGWAQAEGFQMTGMVPDDYESILRRSASHLEEFAERIPVGEKVVAEGVNCFQCHPKPDGSFAQDPVAWAPSLTNVQYRLREWCASGSGTRSRSPRHVDAAELRRGRSAVPGPVPRVLERPADRRRDGLALQHGRQRAGQSTASVDLDSLADDQLLALLRARGLGGGSWQRRRPLARSR